MKTENVHVLMARLIHVNLYKNIYKAVLRVYCSSFVISSYEEFSSQFEEYILPMSAFVVWSREFHVLIVQGELIPNFLCPLTQEILYFRILH